MLYLYTYINYNTKPFKRMNKQCNFNCTSFKLIQFNLTQDNIQFSWDIEKLEGYHAGTSGSEFNLPDFSARLTCAANMDMDGEVMAAKGGPPPFQSSPKKA